MNDLVNPTYLETLVGEGKKYQSAEDLAKAYTHASAHITELKLKEKDLSEHMTTLQSLNDLLTQANKQPVPPVEPPALEAPVVTPPVEQPKGGEPVDVESVVASFLAKRESEQRQREVYDAIVGQFQGDTTKAAEFLAKKAADHGVTPEWFVEQAGRSPAVVRNLLGLHQAPAKGDPAARSDVNPQALGAFSPADNGRDYAYWSNLRKTSPRDFNQLEMEKELMRMGPDKFYGRK